MTGKMHSINQHGADSNGDQWPDPRPGFYYVSVIRDGQSPDRHRLLLGPFIDDHARALELVDTVANKAMDLDPRACWYAFGTCRVECAHAPAPGILNALMPDIAPAIGGKP